LTASRPSVGTDCRSGEEFARNLRLQLDFLWGSIRGRRLIGASQWGGATMVPDDPAKRKRGSIWAQLGTSACVILLPPALIAAGVVLFDSSWRRAAEPEIVAGEDAASQSTFVKSEERPDGVRTLALASAARRTVMVERHRVGERIEVPAPLAMVGLQADQNPADPTGPGTANEPGTTNEPVAANDHAAVDERTATNEPTVTNLSAAASEPAPNYGPIPVALVYIRKPGAPPATAEIEPPAVAEDEVPAAAENKQTAMADIEEPPSTVTHRHAPVAVPKPSLAVTRIRGAHVSRKMAPHEPIAAHRGKPEHVAERGPAHGLEHGRLPNERRKVAVVAAAAAGAGLRHGPLHKGRIGRS
jgi:hypothetical protein